MTLTQLELQKSLLENHLAFAAFHRGKVMRQNGIIYIESSKPGVCWNIPEENANLIDVIKNHNMIRLLPWSSITEQELTEKGYCHTKGITYMVLKEPAFFTNFNSSSKPNDIEINVVSDRKEMDLFTDIQTRGFLEEGESHEDWYAWLGKYNQSNLGNPDQIFYIASIKGKPAGTTLLLMTEKVGGIYAVATLPEYRKKGVSTAILARAISDAKNKKCHTITLQAVTGSYAESFYGRMGFYTSFISPIYELQAKDGKDKVTQTN